jgi:hypothetical protein
MSDALFDSYMLSNFPSRTLDELDDMDALRFFRAMAARNIQMVEDTRVEQKAGTKKGKDIPKHIYKKFLEHDKIFREFEESLLNGEQYNPTGDSS